MVVGVEEPVLKLFELSVGRVLTKSASRHEPWKASLDAQTIKHIVDWLTAAVVNEEPWLCNVDEFGRPKKLLKFSKLSEIAKEAIRQW